MKKFNYILFSIMILICASCGTLEKSKTFRPNTVELNISMDNLKYLGQSEITVTYRTYFGGLIKVIDKVNDNDYNSFEVRKVSLGSQMLDGKISKAAYKVLEEYPEATYFQPIYKTKKVNRLFLGREITTTAVIRAYTFK